MFCTHVGSLVAISSMALLSVKVSCNTGLNASASEYKRRSGVERHRAAEFCEVLQKIYLLP